MADPSGTHPHFRLNFEQQGKRAKELLKLARSGDPATLERFGNTPPKLAEAQYLIARELRFDNWPHLKRHIAAMTHEREAMRGGTVLDADLRTLHVRCGSDLMSPLQQAGLHGDFYEHNYPYSIGPVREGPGSLEQRARFLVEAYGDDRDPPLEYEPVLDGLKRDEQRLIDSADYERVVIWSEYDCYDQLALLRLLAHYAIGRRPPRLELVNCGAFPGSLPYIGLGHLPPEALRLLWARREPAAAAQLQLGLEAWQGLASPDPRALAATMRSATPALPLLAPALHRHLAELPSSVTGLSLTEELALRLLAQQPHSLNRIFGSLNGGIDPLPGQGDFQLRDRVLGMEGATARVFTREPGVDRQGRARPPWTDVLTITDLGRAVLRGEVDFRTLDPPSRWVGGVELRAGMSDWRWDETRRDALRR